MADKATSSNSLLTNKAPEATLSVQLHPLVLLTITDYITRHTSRQQQGPIIGAIIGEQNGRTFTLEAAYQCKTIERDGNVELDAQWFEERLEQYKDVHKVPALDLVGLFMLGAVDGPEAFHARMVKQVQTLITAEGLMLLLFHPDLVDQLQGGKLPITLYEGVQVQQEGTDSELKFRELSFEVETGEAERIGVDFVAAGGGNATAVPKAEAAAAVPQASTAAESSSSKEKKTKGKGKAKDDGEANGASAGTTNVLSPEDEELIASLTAKANAIKMLNSRINLIRAYLKSQPSSYLTDATSTEQPPADTTNHTLLRSINAMLSRLPLLSPPTSTPAATTNTSPMISTPIISAADKEKSDVLLTSLLATLTRSVHEAQSMGSKFHIMSREKANKDRSPFGGGGGGGGGGGRGRDALGFGNDSSLLTSGDNGAF